MVNIEEKRDLFYEQLFENSSNIQILVDGENNQIINANKLACKFYGYSKEQIKELKIYDIENTEKIKESILKNCLDFKNNKVHSIHKLVDNSLKDVTIVIDRITINDKMYYNLTVSESEFEFTENINSYNKSDFIKTKYGGTINVLNCGCEMDQVICKEKISKKILACRYNILEHLPVAVVISFDIEQNMIYQNAKFEEYFGYTICDFPEIKDWWLLAYPDLEYRKFVAKEWNLRLEKAIKNQSSIMPMEVDITSKDGTVKHIRVHAVIFGKMNFITFVDMTERKKAEKALRLANNYNRSLIESSLDAFMIINSQGKITDVNSATERATGYSREQLIGSDISNYFTEPKKIKEANDKVFKNGVNLEDEVELMHKNGVFSTALYNACVYRDEAYKVIGVFVSARDITERKIREIELEKAKKVAEDANVLKSQFIANMSHELRTPVNVIFSAIQLLELYINNNLDVGSVKSKKHLKAMKKNCNRLVRLINNIIDVTKIEAGFMELQMKNVNIVSVVEDITVSVEQYAKDKGIYVQFDTEIEEKIMPVDQDKIERIMLNLLSNSIKFTKRDGNILVDIYDKGASILICVKDSGIGIPKEKINQVFERFIQVENTMIRSSEGSGIGLSIVKSFVEMHGGTIKVVSELGIGTEFLIELPLDDSSITEGVEISEINRNYEDVIGVEFSDIYK